MTRKLGISYVVISQYAGLPTFGGLEPLRSSIMAGNALVMYTRSKSPGNLMAGLEVDPLTIPQIKGYAYTMRTGATGRVAPFRNRLITNPAERWIEDAPRWSLNEQDAVWVMEAYAKRATDVSQIRAAQGEILRKVMSGEISPEAAMAGAKSAAEAHDIVQRASGTPGAMQTGPVAERMEALVGSVPSWPDVSVSDIKAPVNAEEADNQARIIAAIRDGATKPSQIVAALAVDGCGKDLKDRRVRQLLTELVADGKVHDGGQGVWKLREQAGSAD
ncbi:hypothetical protein [Actinopolymorpha pittospori]|uniref:Uncharacterized protein n=1 Tax=Actinopolymorpha pittospori TaxID=648752 RepID=A0A927MWQ9_9ACTN|nr:hypothetical protein [Actinopolymorpha pittospori]MBE1608019.1 hypothetical protein [Actinopolymorpha pittospori]